jgi:hypothetical protein
MSTAAKRTRFALTTFEWTLVFCAWAVIGLFAYAILCDFVSPPRHHTAPRNACINNLRQIDGAKEQWALETNHSTNDLCMPREVDAYIKGGGPACPEGGKYIYGKVGEPPRCTIATHVLP